MHKSIKEFLETIGINITLSIAGFIGSLIWVSTENQKDFKFSLVGIISGTLSANYLTPLVIESFALGDKTQFGVAFILGYFGLKGMEKVSAKYLVKK